MRKKVLVAEDYDDSREFMKFILESYGYQVVEAKDGLQAIEVAKQQHPDLILMDISMPVMDGLTATRMIRESDDDISQLPIIALTAFGESYNQKAAEAGCNDLISKPLDFEIFEPTLNRFCSV